jgi:ABC-type branched-subunit amino acid transport system substrate-binding protein
VIAAAATIPGVPTLGQTRFVEAYEAQFRRTLRSPIPALGYDAALLLLESIRATGARTPADLARGLASIVDLPGATGTLSIRDGRIVRRHRLVRFQDGVLVPLEPEASP